MKLFPLVLGLQQEQLVCGRVFTQQHPWAPGSGTKLEVEEGMEVSRLALPSRGSQSITGRGPLKDGDGELSPGRPGSTGKRHPWGPFQSPWGPERGTGTQETWKTRESKRSTREYFHQSALEALRRGLPCSPGPCRFHQASFPWKSVLSVLKSGR